jgi:hypothetical protein
MAVYSRVTGLAFLAAFAGVASGSSSSAVVIPFFLRPQASVGAIAPR